MYIHISILEKICVPFTTIYLMKTKHLTYISILIGEINHHIEYPPPLSKTPLSGGIPKNPSLLKLYFIRAIIVLNFSFSSDIVLAVELLRN